MNETNGMARATTRQRAPRRDRGRGGEILNLVASEASLDRETSVELARAGAAPC
jgi:hypothetical protein